ncbi:MAG: TIR domain-containing protein [Bradyrhizobium sp.]
MPTEQNAQILGSMREFLRASRGKSQRHILETFLQEIIHAGHFSQAGSILTHFPEDKKLRLFNPDNFLVKHGYLRADEPWQAEFRYGEGVAGKVFVRREGKLVIDITKEPDFTTVEGQVPIRSMICVPIVLDDRSEPFGVASFHNYDADRLFSEAAKDQAEIYTNVLGLALAAASEKLDRRRPGQRRVFIGCASEDIDVARKIQKQLDREALVQIWDQGVFKAGGYVLETLLRLVKEIDFAIFLLTPRDIIEFRGKKHLVARDNVLFEAGLFYSQLGRHRTFLVVPRAEDLKLPSDLEGLIHLTYTAPENWSDIASALGPICSDIIDALRSPLPTIV